jgi:hypothetical protein
LSNNVSILAREDAMQNNESINKEINNKNHPISIDFEDLDQLEFKSISKGLGLENNTSRKPPVQFIQKTSSANRNDSREQKNNRSLREIDLNIKVDEPKRVPQPQAKLPQLERSKTEQVQVQKVIKSAETPIRIAAYLLDIGIVALITAFTLFCFSFFSGLPFDVLINLVGQIDFILFSMMIFSTFYLIYFAILEASATVGKAYFKLKLANDISTSKGDLNFNVILSRTLISLASLLLLGIPFIFLLQDRITKSRVVIVS